MTNKIAPATILAPAVTETILAALAEAPIKNGDSWNEFAEKLAEKLSEQFTLVGRVEVKPDTARHTFPEYGDTPNGFVIDNSEELYLEEVEQYAAELVESVRTYRELGGE